MRKAKVILTLSLFWGYVAAQAQWTQGKGDGIQYWKYQPAQSLKHAGPGLMVGLHGCTQHASDMKDLGNWEEAADANNWTVILPDVPNGGVVMGCWDYYGTDQNSTNKNNAVLIHLTESILAADSHIDPSRVFVAGISSGAGEALLLGCMRPDLFHGLGINSGPALGTGRNDLIDPQTDSKKVAQFCLQLAGDKASFFATQQASFIRGDSDYVVNPKHSEINIAAMQEVYATVAQRDFDLSTMKGAMKAGKGIIFYDVDGHARISSIINNGLGHAWASGSGKGSTTRFINPQSISYPDYLGDFFEP
jgi:poly(3-hydroxybutyrate) depolymerase